MIFHQEEYLKATQYWQNRDFPHITPDQHALILEKGKDLIKFHLRHPASHHLISVSVFIIIFSLDFWVLLHLGAYIKGEILADSGLTACANIQSIIL